MLLPLAAMIAGAILYDVALKQSMTSPPGRWMSLAIPAACFVPLLVSIVAIGRGQRRIKRAVRGADGRACLHCVNDLTGLGESGACPECGAAFDIPAGKRAWARVNMNG